MTPTPATLVFWTWLTSTVNVAQLPEAPIQPPVAAFDQRRAQLLPCRRCGRQPAYPVHLRRRDGVHGGRWLDLCATDKKLLDGALPDVGRYPFY